MNKHLIAMIFLIAAGSLLAQTTGIQDSYNLESSGNYTGALQIMQNLAAQDSTEPFYQARIAWLQYLLGDYQNALASYQNAARSLNHLDAWTGMINCYLALANWNEALRIAQEQLRTHSQNPTLLGKAAYASYMKRDYQAAAQYFATIVQYYPWDMDNRAYLLNNLYLAGRIDEARTEYFKLKKYYPASTMLSEYRSIFEP